MRQGRAEVLKIKAAVRIRDGFKCVECGLSVEAHMQIHGSTLEVHRLVPGSKYTIEGAVSLCRRCHGPKPKRPYGQRFRDESIIVVYLSVDRAKRQADRFGMGVTTYIREATARQLELDKAADANRKSS